MPNTFAVYVPAKKPGPANLEAGLDQLVWGWKDSLIARGTNGAVARSMRAGDLLVLATNGPDPRVGPGGWASASIGPMHLARLTSELYRDAAPVWPDELTGEASYPNRVSFELVYETTDRRALHSEPSVAEALRWSANTQGGPVVVGLPEGVAPRLGLGDDGSDQLDIEGPYDVAVMVLARREQQAIRARKFGRREQVTCDLCARTLPTRLVRAAHIKRRADCNSRERANLHNVMAACALGCDELFEHGYVAVDGRGEIVVGRKASGDVADAAGALIGRACGAHSQASARFFAFHRQQQDFATGSSILP